MAYSIVCVLRLFRDSQISWFQMMMLMMMVGVATTYAGDTKSDGWTLTIFLLVYSIILQTLQREILPIFTLRHCICCWWIQSLWFCENYAFPHLDNNNIEYMSGFVCIWASFCKSYSYVRCKIHAFEWYLRTRPTRWTQINVKWENICVKLDLSLWFLHKPEWIFIAIIKFNPYAYKIFIQLLSWASKLILKACLSNCVLSENEKEENLHSNHYTLRTYYYIINNGLPGWNASNFRKNFSKDKNQQSFIEIVVVVVDVKW